MAIACAVSSVGLAIASSVRQEVELMIIAAFFAAVAAVFGSIANSRSSKRRTLPSKMIEERKEKLKSCAFPSGESDKKK